MKLSQRCAKELTTIERRIQVIVENAQGDAQKQRSQADGCLANGAKVILLDQLDPASGAAITNVAVAGGAKVIDYDRLVVGSKAPWFSITDDLPQYQGHITR